MNEDQQPVAEPATDHMPDNPSDEQADAVLFLEWKRYYMRFFTEEEAEILAATELKEMESP